jgi:hypothetical protein
MTLEEFKKLEHNHKITLPTEELGRANRLNDILSACYLLSNAQVSCVRDLFYHNIAHLYDDQGTLICDWYSTPTAHEMKVLDTFWEIFGNENSNSVEHYRLAKQRL